MTLFKIKKWLAHLLVALDAIIIRFRLRLLNLRYGRGNVPKDKISALLTIDKESQLIITRIFEVSDYVLVLLHHYGVDPSTSRTQDSLTRLTTLGLESPEEESEILDLLDRADHAKVVLEHMLNNGDIPPHKYTYYPHPSEHESEQLWLDHITERATKSWKA